MSKLLNSVHCARCESVELHPRSAHEAGWAQWDQAIGEGLQRVWRCADCEPDLFEVTS